MTKIADVGKQIVSNDKIKIPSVRRIVVLPVAMVVWILVADPSVLGLNKVNALGQLLSNTFGVHLDNREHF
jgi:hypothetical protein